MQKKKICYFDVETTGFDSKLNGIIQLSGAIEIDGEVKETFNFKVKPFPQDVISDEALAVSGTTRGDLENYHDPKMIFKEFIAILGKYVSKFDKNDKFYPAGFNVSFDIGFLRDFFIKNGDNYYGSWFNYRYLDPLPYFHFLEVLGHTSDFENLKLGTICQKYGIEIKAHDALSDILATREVVQKVFNSVQKI